jgi:DNA invertase Pin-like site-specific DNA recombinase
MFTDKDVDQLKLDKMTKEEAEKYARALDMFADFVTLKEAAQHFGKHYRTIKRWIDNDDVRVVWKKFGTARNSTILVSLNSLEILYAQLEREKNHERI